MVDITIRGAGIFGLSIAWACCQKGAKVRVIDPAGPGAGSSGGLVGALAPHVPENWNAKKAFQMESLLTAASFWNEVAQSGGKTPSYTRSGRLQPIVDAAALALAERRRDTAGALWGARASWQIIPVPQDGWSVHSPTGYVIHDTLSALIHPRRAIASLVAALGKRGVAIEQSGADQGKVLWATGVAGLVALNADHHRQVGNGVKGQAALLEHNAAGTPQLFVNGLHIIPHLDGTVAIGSTSEREYEDPARTDAQLEEVITRARAAVPALAAAKVIDRWAGVRPRSRSRAPMLGEWPGRPGHYIANGGFKIGFGMAPKIAQVMSDLMLEGLNGIPEGFEVNASF